jgi:hypothetical protein
MPETSLAQAVEQFAGLTQAIPDSALDLDWAWGAYDSEGVRFAFFRMYEELRELAVKVESERLVRGVPLTSAQRILAQYHAAHRDMQAALLGTGAELAAQPPAEGEWPPQKIVAHMVGAELGFYGVVRYALDRYLTGDGVPAEIPEEAWDALIGEDEATTTAVLNGPFEGIVEYYDAFHARVLREFAEITDEELALPSMYWEGHELSLRFRLHRFDSHLRQHTVQIDKTLEAVGHAPGEAGRLLRLIYAALAEAEGATIGEPDVAAKSGRRLAEAIAARTAEIASIVA